MKHSTFIALGAFAIACGPQAHSTGIQTPDEILAEQERLGAEQVRETEANAPTGSDTETDLEKAAKWDPDGAELEMKRAALSAETCPDSVTEKAPAGNASVTVVFNNDGHVKTATVSSPYDGTAVGRCVQRAFEAVIVKRYGGPEETMEWKVDLTGKKKKKEGAKKDEEE